MVKFENLEEAQAVVENLNGNVPQGLESPITVKFATTAADKQHTQCAQETYTLAKVGRASEGKVETGTEYEATPGKGE